MKLAVLFIPLVMCLGCVSPWEGNFQPNPELEGQKFEPTESAQIRTVEFERLQRYAHQEQQERVESSTAPEDLSAEEKLAAKNRLLDTLQLRERGNEIDVLGWSEFSSDGPLNPNGGDLEKFARKIGADYVVVASEYAGPVHQVIDRPMTAYSHAVVVGRHGYVAQRYETVWVPVNVVVDRYLYTAAFLRKIR